MNRFLLGILIATSVTAAFGQVSTNDIRQFGGHRVRNEEIKWSSGERPLIVEEPTICTMDRGKLGNVPVRLEPGDRVLGKFSRSDDQFDYYLLTRFGDCGNEMVGEVRIKRKAGTTTVVKPEAKRAMLPPPPAPGDVNVYTSLNLDIPINVTTNTNNYGATGDRPQRPLPAATMIAGVRSANGLSALSYGEGSKTNVTQIGGGATATGGNATATGGQGGNASASSSSSSTSTSTAAASAKSKGK